MRASRVISVLTLALAWCWGAWHADLEAAGWMFHHDHHHANHGHAEASGHHQHDAEAEDDHQPVWARDFKADARMAPWLLLLLLTAAALADQEVRRIILRPNTIRPSGRARQRAGPVESVWHILRRCAPDVAAPPFSI